MATALTKTAEIQVEDADAIHAKMDAETAQTQEDFRLPTTSWEPSQKAEKDYIRQSKMDLVDKSSGARDALADRPASCDSIGS